MADDTHTADEAKGSSRLENLLTQLDKLLNERYAFDVFATDSVNYGIMVTYRQKWEPQNYQVGDLVSTIPLAPKEMRRFTSRTVTKRSRNVKELDDALNTRRSEASDTTRVEEEIVAKAQSKSSFQLTAKETLGGENQGYTIDATQTASGDQAKQSERTKKDFRESVLKSAQEFKKQRKTEIDTTESSENENTTFHEIQNPNDELTVTYLFYELQRTYRISEKLHRVTPVILVPNDVPAPNEINDAWLVEHDWILRRAILDDSFRPALEYLTTSFVGAEVNIRILEGNALAQKAVVDSIQQQIRTQAGILSRGEQDVLNAVQQLGESQKQEGLLNIVKGFFDPIRITGEADTGAIDAAQAMVDYTRETRDRADRERARLFSELEVAVTALQEAVDKLAAAVKEHYDRVAQIDRLRVHVKDNILHYMQAIWDHEPTDQRFFRLYKRDVAVVEPSSAGATAEVHAYQRGTYEVFHDPTPQLSTVKLPVPQVKTTWHKLVDVADLDTLLGYKGNYMIFPLKENNYITLHMMQDYLSLGDELVLRDPDEFSDYTLDELQELAACVRRRDPEVWKQHKETFRKLVVDRLTSPRQETDLVVVPTSSLYIEALLGTHPLLEDFKLIHRALDVKKVQAEVRHTELENIRLAGRLLDGTYEDPDIEKKVIVEAGPANVDVETNGH